MLQKPVKLIELFAGIGSQAMALRKLGITFDYHKAIEFDSYAVASYNAVHGTNIQTTDIKNVHAKDLDISNTKDYTYFLTYSFPCTDLSVAGKRLGMSKDCDTRSGLLWEVERILQECDKLPQVLLMENVPQVHNTLNSKDFRLWQDFLQCKGYENYCFDLNSTDVDMPQCRNRCFMVSLLNGYSFNESFLESLPGLHKSVREFLETNVPSKYYLSEKMRIYIAKRGTKDYHARPEVNPPIAHALVTTMHKMHRSGIDNYYDDRFITTGASNVHFITTEEDEQNVINCTDIRRLTPRECWRLMGFPDDAFDRASKVNSDTQLYMQAGNSIVVNCLTQIIQNIDEL